MNLQVGSSGCRCRLYNRRPYGQAGRAGCCFDDQLKTRATAPLKHRYPVHPFDWGDNAAIRSGDSDVVHHRSRSNRRNQGNERRQVRNVSRTIVVDVTVATAEGPLDEKSTFKCP